MQPRNKERTPLSATLFSLLLIIGIVVGWHLLFPFAGIITSTVWGVILGTIAMLSAVGVLFLIFSTFGILILGLLALIWVAVVLALFPMIFPLVAPVLIITMLVGFVMSRKRR